MYFTRDPAIYQYFMSPSPQPLPNLLQNRRSLENRKAASHFLVPFP